MKSRVITICLGALIIVASIIGGFYWYDDAFGREGIAPSQGGYSEPILGQANPPIIVVTYVTTFDNWPWKLGMPIDPLPRYDRVKCDCDDIALYTYQWLTNRGHEVKIYGGYPWGEYHFWVETDGYVYDMGFWIVSDRYVGKENSYKDLLEQCRLDYN